MSKISRLVINRIATSLVVLFLLITLIFILLRVAPGDPAQKFISPALSPQLSTNISKSFNLDKPIYVQYISFVGNIITGNFGVSYNYHKPVLSVISDYFLFTFLFSTISLLLQLFVSFFLARAAFKKPGGMLDAVLSKLTLVVYIIPSFVLGLVLVYIFSIKLKILPTSGLKSIDSDDFDFFSSTIDHLSHIILPLITLSLSGIAMFYKYLRDNLEETRSKTFVTNLKAMGIHETEIFYKHILPNAIRPLISIIGIEFGVLLSGALITEVIFSLPGMGRLTVNAIFNRDYPLIMGCTFAAAVVMILSNLASDLIKIKIDKRLLTDLMK